MFEFATFDHDALDYEYSDDSGQQSEPFQHAEQYQDEHLYNYHSQLKNNQILFVT